MAWTIRRVDETHAGLFAGGALVVTATEESAPRLLRLRDHLAARERPTCASR
jgi:hypothetical protein